MCLCVLKMSVCAYRAQKLKANISPEPVKLESPWMGFKPFSNHSLLKASTLGNGQSFIHFCFKSAFLRNHSHTIKYSSMSFDKCIQSKNHHHSQDIHFHRMFQENISFPLWLVLSSFHPSSQTTGLLSIMQFCLFQNFMKRNHTVCISIMLLQFIHVVCISAVCSFL